MLQSDFPLSARSRLIGMYYVFFAGSQAIGSYLSGLMVVTMGLFNTLLAIAAMTVAVFAIYAVKPTWLWRNV